MKLLSSFLNCEYFQKKMDIFSMKKRNKTFSNDINYGNPFELEKYIENVDLNRYTATPDFLLESIPLKSLNRPILNPAGIKLIQEEITLPSKIKTGKVNVDKAEFYIFRKGSLKNRNVIIVAPGGPLSDFYFGFLRDHLNNLIKKDFDIMFYIPPYFLDRKEKNKDFFMLNTQNNIFIMLKSISELRTALKYLKMNKAGSIGFFGGSIGGSMILLLSILENIDHVSVLEPVVDWRFTLIKNKHMKKLKTVLNRAGFCDELLLKAYGIISPSAYLPNSNLKNIQVLYPKYDQYTPEKIMYNFVKKWEIKYFNEYKRSHVTVLFNGEMFKGYFSFLDKIKKI